MRESYRRAWKRKVFGVRNYRDSANCQCRNVRITKQTGHFWFWMLFTLKWHVRAESSPFKHLPLWIFNKGVCFSMEFHLKTANIRIIRSWLAIIYQITSDDTFVTIVGDCQTNCFCLPTQTSDFIITSIKSANKSTVYKLCICGNLVNYHKNVSGSPWNSSKTFVELVPVQMLWRQKFRSNLGKLFHFLFIPGVSCLFSLSQPLDSHFNGKICEVC